MRKDTLNWLDLVFSADGGDSLSNVSVGVSDDNAALSGLLGVVSSHDNVGVAAFDLGGSGDVGDGSVGSISIEVASANTVKQSINNTNDVFFETYTLTTSFSAISWVSSFNGEKCPITLLIERQVGKAMPRSIFLVFLLL